MQHAKSAHFQPTQRRARRIRTRWRAFWELGFWPGEAGDRDAVEQSVDDLVIVLSAPVADSFIMHPATRNVLPVQLGRMQFV